MLACVKTLFQVCLRWAIACFTPFPLARLVLFRIQPGRPDRSAGQAVTAKRHAARGMTRRRSTGVGNLAPAAALSVGVSRTGSGWHREVQHRRTPAYPGGDREHWPSLAVEPPGRSRAYFSSTAQGFATGLRPSPRCGVFRRFSGGSSTQVEGEVELRRDRRPAGRSAGYVQAVFRLQASKAQVLSLFLHSLESRRARFRVQGVYGTMMRRQTPCLPIRTVEHDHAAPSPSSAFWKRSQIHERTGVLQVAISVADSSGPEEQMLVTTQQYLHPPVSRSRRRPRPAPDMRRRVVRRASVRPRA